MSPSRHLRILTLSLLLGAASLSAADQAAPKREGIEWLDVWVTSGNKPAASPRVLLIGDSITRAYYGEAAKAMGDKVVCDRLATSAGLGDPLLPLQIELMLHQYHYDVVHMNNGMHGWDYSESEYGAAIRPLLKVLQRGAPQARLIWATTTPTAGGAQDRNPRIIERNRLVRTALAGTDVVIDDLYAVIAADATVISKDGVHMDPKGSAALGAQVARAVAAALAPGGK